MPRGTDTQQPGETDTNTSRSGGKRHTATRIEGGDTQTERHTYTGKGLHRGEWIQEQQPAAVAHNERGAHTSVAQERRCAVDPATVTETWSPSVLL